MNNNSKKVIVLALFIIAAFFIKIKKDAEAGSTNLEQINYLSIEYKNNSDKQAKFRYKYILSYTPATKEINQELKKEVPVFSLHRESEKISEVFPIESYNEFIPVVSETFSVGKNQEINDSFEVKIEPSVKNKEMIKFETKIILEQLKGNKWTSVYQVILMERGPYFSLDKGPIEFIKP